MCGIMHKDWVLNGKMFYLIFSFLSLQVQHVRARARGHRQVTVRWLDMIAGLILPELDFIYNLRVNI